MKLTISIIFIFFLFPTLAQTKDSTDKTTIQKIKCEDPHFPGGDEALKTFLKSNLSLVDSSLCNRSGIVYVQIEIDSTGKILNPKIKRGVKREFDQEALRLFRIMPNWIPMICDGLPRQSNAIIPVIIRSE